MCRRTISTLTAAAAVAALLLAPAAGQARTHAGRAGLKDHCVVKQLPGNLTLTVCYPT
jgi:hypothetical protein